MNLRNVESYQIGLDIGTGSVGWAVLDGEGNLCRFKGEPTWGSRVFPTANTTHRSGMVQYGMKTRHAPPIESGHGLVFAFMVLEQ